MWSKLDELYSDAPADLAADDANITLGEDLINGMLARIYQREYGKKGTDGIDLPVYNATRSIFNRAAATGVAEAMDAGTPAPDVDFLHRIDRNNAIFSAFRTHRMQKDVAALMLDDNGKTKPFRRFAQDVEGVIGKYRKDWLHTEYATAVQRSRLAANWRQYADEQDVFPNLEWVPSTAIHPGEDHRIFWHTIQPVNSSFWDHHRPGDRYNCQCDLRQTVEPPTDIPTTPINDGKNSPAPGLDNNPGKDGVLFNDSHPYFPTSCTNCPFASVGKKLMALARGNRNRNRNRNCIECIEVVENGEYSRTTYKSGGYVEYPQHGRQNAAEWEKNKRAVEELARYYGKKYRLLPVINRHGQSNPDARNMETQRDADVKNPTSESGKNAIQTSIKAASKQRVAEVIIYLTRDYSRSEIMTGIKAALQQNRARSVKTMIIRFNDGEIKQYNVDKLRPLFKEKDEKE